MRSNYKIWCFLLLVFSVGICRAQQPQFSFATDLSLQKSIREGQKYWALGQTFTAQFNFSPKDAAYAWMSYYTKGDFDNQVTATAKQAATIPQDISYHNHSTMGIREISMGWKHYLVGRCDAEDKWNLYTLLGLGLMFGKVDNIQSPTVDTSLYHNPVLPGEAKFKRLTYDLGLGVEKPLAGFIYLYLEGKTFIPSTDYPSDHLLVNHNAPLMVNLSLGVRILFD